MPGRRRDWITRDDPAPDPLQCSDLHEHRGRGAHPVRVTRYVDRQGTQVEAWGAERRRSGTMLAPWQSAVSLGSRGKQPLVAGAGRPPALLIGGGDRTFDTRSPQKPGLAAREAGHRTIGKPTDLTPGSMKVKTGAGARRGPMSARSPVQSLANRDAAGWVS